MADTKVINGVKTIDYRGKSYVEVAERLRHVHEKKCAFEVLDSEVLEIAGRVLCRVTISVDGKIFKGIAEAKVSNAAPRSADASNPFECGETSALGRALAFAGLGTVDSIASYDEMTRSVPLDDNAQSNGGVANPPARPTPAPAQPARPAPVPPPSTQPATPLNAIPVKSAIKKMVEDIGMEWGDFVAQAFKPGIDAKAYTTKQILDLEWKPGHCEQAYNYLQTLKNAA